MNQAIKELITIFKEETNINCKIVLGSSGKLCAQIEAGAPYDIFLSANAKYTEYLTNKNTNYATSQTYAIGKLAVFSTTINTDNLLQKLTSTKVEKIAIPNPNTAPYGEIAKESLLKLGLYQKIQPKLVFGENVQQTNQFVVAGAADVGFTSVSTFYSKSPILKKAHWTAIPDSLYTPLQQQILILNNNTNTQKFIDFMLSNKAQKILQNYGYGSIQ